MTTRNLFKACLFTLLSIAAVPLIFGVLSGHWNELGFYGLVAFFISAVAIIPLLFWGIPWHLYLMTQQHYAMRGYLLVSVAASVMTQLVVLQLWPEGFRLDTEGLLFGAVIALIAAIVFWYHAVYRVLLAPDASLPDQCLVQRLHRGYVGKTLRWLVRQRLLQLLQELALYNDKGCYWSGHDDRTIVLRRAEITQLIQHQLWLLPASIAVDTLQDAIASGNLSEDSSGRYCQIAKASNFIASR